MLVSVAFKYSVYSLIGYGITSPLADYEQSGLLPELGFRRLHEAFGNVFAYSTAALFLFSQFPQINRLPTQPYPNRPATATENTYEDIANLVRQNPNAPISRDASVVVMHGEIDGEELRAIARSVQTRGRPSWPA